MTKTCKTCGHRQIEHAKECFHINHNYLNLKIKDYCPCKKFEPEDELSKSDKKLLKNVKVASKIVLKEDEELLKELGKEKPQKQGCGKEIDFDGEDPIICGEEMNGEIRLCPSCSGNHTRQEEKALKKAGSSKGGRRTQLADKEPGVQTSKKNVCIDTSGSDFNLSEKILDKQNLHSGVLGLFDLEDVKTFIKKLVEEIYQEARKKPYINYITHHKMLELIHKLVGEKLR